MIKGLVVLCSGMGVMCTPIWKNRSDRRRSLQVTFYWCGPAYLLNYLSSYWTISILSGETVDFKMLNSECHIPPPQRFFMPIRTSSALCSTSDFDQEIWEVHFSRRISATASWVHEETRGKKNSVYFPRLSKVWSRGFPTTICLPASYFWDDFSPICHLLSKNVSGQGLY